LRAFSDSRDGRRAGRPVGFPQFKRRGRSRNSFAYSTGSFGVSGRTRVRLPRIGHVRTHEPTSQLQRLLEAGHARILSATVTADGGRWYCAFCCEVDRPEVTPARSGLVVGVDVGITHLAVLSSGEQVPNPRALEKARRQLRRCQRTLDRQRRANNPDCYDPHGRALHGRRPTRRSGRQQRTERRLARMHARVANVRCDAIHKLTRRLTRKHSTVVIERLNVRGLCRAGNRGLRRAVHDAGLAEIRRQLAYKTEWYGVRLIAADTFFPSSKLCSGCGTAKATLPLSERTCRCAHCGLEIDRDLNAARNLAALAVDGVAVSATETRNARSLTQVGPGLAGRRVDREAGTPRAGDQTGSAFEQSKAA
jgi:putative transposase